VILTRVLTALLTITVLASTANSETLLATHNAEYKVKISVLSGKLNTSLRQTDAGYVAHHVIKTTGFARWYSKGTMDVRSEFSASLNDGVRPMSFRSVDTLRKDPPITLQFDWENNKAIGSVGGEPVEFQLDGILHDSVSIQYALMHDLLNGDPAAQYSLFDINKIRIAIVSNAGSKKIRTKAGRYQTIGIRTQREGSSRTTTMWCAEELGYLPVVIEQHRKGKLKFRATLVRYESLEAESSLAEDDGELHRQ
jgi:hypothetical protein